MKKVLLASVGILALSAGAFAADLPSKKPPALLPVATPSTWNGPYVGVNAGYTWSNSAATLLATGQNAFATTGKNGTTWTPYSWALPGHAKLNTDGFIGGGQVGWNYTLGNLFVVGLEGSIEGLAANTKTTTFPLPGLGVAPAAAQLGRAWDWAGIGAGRAGFLLTPTLLVYGKGGFAFGHATNSVTAYDNAMQVAWASGQTGKLYTGYALGGGVEWMFLPNWSAKIEYLHVDMGKQTASFQGFAYGTVPPKFGQPATLFLASMPVRQESVKVGVNYHFGGLFGM